MLAVEFWDLKLILLEMAKGVDILIYMKPLGDVIQWHAVQYHL